MRKALVIIDVLVTNLNLSLCSGKESLTWVGVLVKNLYSGLIFS